MLKSKENILYHPVHQNWIFKIKFRSISNERYSFEGDSLGDTVRISKVPLTGI